MLTSGGHSFKISYVGGDGDTLTGVSSTAPVLSGKAAKQAVNETATIQPFAAVTLSDADAGDTRKLTVTSSAAANGVLSGEGVAAGSTAGTYVITGAASAVQTTLRGAVFTPAVNQVAPGSMVTTTFSVTATITYTAAAGALSYAAGASGMTFARARPGATR